VSERTVKRTFVGIGAAAIAIGIFVLVYRGPGRAFVRGHVGDVAATMLVYAIVSMVAGIAHGSRRDAARYGTGQRGVMPTMGMRALVTIAIASSIEVAQLWWHARSTVGHLVVGSTFDPIDLAAYVVGVVIAVCWERAASRS
jgi:hypothetical protein